MAQLSDDCFANGGALMRLDEALALLAERIEPVVDTETINLTHALGRILAHDLVSNMDVPPFPNSAVDGYAVYFDDLDPSAETRLPIVGRAAAGHPMDVPCRRGEAARVFTGAPMPFGDDGAPDTVMMQEDCKESGGTVSIRPGISRGANVRDAGEDVAAGDTLLRAGHRLRPQDIGLIASVGRTRVETCQRLRVSLFSTGDELQEPQENAGGLGPGEIFDSNRHTLANLLQGLGCVVWDMGILPDSEDRITSELSGAAETSDLILTSGGMSVGEEDYVKSAVENLGALHFWKLAIKPGRPVALGQVGATPFIGLPGNPVAVMVTFLRVARPLILRLSGAQTRKERHFTVQAGFAHKKKLDRREWVRAHLETNSDGVTVARKFPRQGAGILSSMVAADGLVELPESLTYLEEGDMVAFLPFSEVGL